jgi:hypothetical protein
MNPDQCAGCGHVFTERPLIGAFNTFIGEPRHYSSVFGSDHWLCDGCAEREESLIEDHGNDLPDLLALYNNPSKD